MVIYIYIYLYIYIYIYILYIYSEVVEWKGPSIHTPTGKNGYGVMGCKKNKKRMEKIS